MPKNRLLPEDFTVSSMSVTTRTLLGVIVVVQKRNALKAPSPMIPKLASISSSIEGVKGRIRLSWGCLLLVPPARRHPAAWRSFVTITRVGINRSATHEYEIIPAIKQANRLECGIPKQGTQKRKSGIHHHRRRKKRKHFGKIKRFVKRRKALSYYPCNGCKGIQATAWLSSPTIVSKYQWMDWGHRGLAAYTVSRHFSLLLILLPLAHTSQSKPTTRRTAPQRLSTENKPFLICYSRQGDAGDELSIRASRRCCW